MRDFYDFSRENTLTKSMIRFSAQWIHGKEEATYPGLIHMETVERVMEKQ